MRRFSGTRGRWSGVAASGASEARRAGSKARHRWSHEAGARGAEAGPTIRSGPRSVSGGLKRFMPVRAHWAEPDARLSTEGVPCLSLVLEGVLGEAEVTE
ncbi:hypothetical protein GCM10012319_68660 [Comamonas sp. KCTC 72670]|nr:hypothetical protein GCM10012319_68660 [Comamonas sp. KCTC 72670]